MADERPAGPAFLLLSATIARRYYLDRASKSEIAEEFSLSRFKVARIIEEARQSGLVRIEVGHAEGIDLALSLRLQAEYGLRHCAVVDGPDGPDDAVRANIGRAAARLLTEIVGADDVLGLVWARSLLAMRASLRRLAPCPVVQLTGALPIADVDESSVELAREVARIGGGPSYYFYAPMLVPDAATARALRTQPEIARALAMAGGVTKAVVGVGAWAPGLSTVADAASPDEVREAHDAGVRAEIGGIQLDADGQPVTTSLTDRLIGIGAGELGAVDEVVALVYGTEKTEAVRSALRGGFVTSLVTHGAMARALLTA